jgi:hypothetical protein
MGPNELVEPLIGHNQHVQRANLIANATLIIWNEVPMAHQSTFNCIHETCQESCHNEHPFGGKSLILTGDFCQTCPVVRGGSRSETIEASIKSSSLWRLFHHLHLTVPIRQAADPAYAHFVDAIGDGAGPAIDLSSFRIVHNCIDLINIIYPPHILNDPSLCLN